MLGLMVILMREFYDTNPQPLKMDVGFLFLDGCKEPSFQWIFSFEGTSFSLNDFRQRIFLHEGLAHASKD